MLRLISDENYSGDIVRGLLFRQPRLDLVRLQDVLPLAIADPDLLIWPADNNRIVLTHDRKTMPRFAYERIAAGLSMPGVFVMSDRMPVAMGIESVLLLNECTEQEEWRDRVVHLPL